MTYDIVLVCPYLASQAVGEEPGTSVFRTIEIDTLLTLSCCLGSSPFRWQS
jgi:hypothetical protein